MIIIKKLCSTGMSKLNTKGYEVLFLTEDNFGLVVDNKVD